MRVFGHSRVQYSLGNGQAANVEERWVSAGQFNGHVVQSQTQTVRDDVLAHAHIVGFAPAAQDNGARGSPHIAGIHINGKLLLKVCSG